MTDMGYAVIETGILSFLIGVAIGLQYSKVLHRKWRAKHTCGPVTIEVHGGGGWGGSGLQNPPGGFSDMTGGHGGQMSPDKKYWEYKDKNKQ